MDAPGRPLIIYPSARQIVRINQIQLELKGGLPFVPPFNLRRAGSLDSILYQISEPVYATHPFPSVYHKAAGLAWKIITGHVFHDGNKRTGMHAGLAMLRINHKTILVTDDELVDAALAVAESYRNDFTVDDLTAWLYWHAR